MKPTIKVTFYLESRDADFSAIDKILQIKPSIYRTVFPPNSIAVPYWKTEVIEENYEVEKVAQILLNKIQPKTDAIKDLCCRFHMNPTVVIKITAKYENGPFVSISPGQVSFFASIGARLIVDLEGLYPDEIDAGDDSVC